MKPAVVQSSVVLTVTGRQTHINSTASRRLERVTDVNYCKTYNNSTRYAMTDKPSLEDPVTRPKVLSADEQYMIKDTEHISKLKVVF